jgi:hypothetical protein
MESKHPDGISGPLKARLSNPKRICSCPNVAEVNTNPQISNVIVQLRDPRRAQNLVTSFREETDLVGAFFAPDRKIKNQVFSGSRNFQRCVTRLRLALPASHRPLTKIQDCRVSCFHGVSASHQQPSPNREKQNCSSRHPSQDTSALHRRLPTKLLEFLKARTA